MSFNEKSFISDINKCNFVSWIYLMWNKFVILETETWWLHLWVAVRNGNVLIFLNRNRNIFSIPTLWCAYKKLVVHKLYNGISKSSYNNTSIILFLLIIPHEPHWNQLHPNWHHQTQSDPTRPEQTQPDMNKHHHTWTDPTGPEQTPLGWTDPTGHEQTPLDLKRPHWSEIGWPLLKYVLSLLA